MKRPVPEADENKRARGAVYVEVRAGRLLRPDRRSCADCGSAASEYDHYLGYDRFHWLDVEAVCKGCNATRENKRRLTARQAKRAVTGWWV